MAKVARLEVVFGKMEGTEGRFTRDPSGFLFMEAGIFRKHGLEVAYRHLQGTEDRYEEVKSGKANLSLVVGRNALKHFLDAGITRVIGCSINSCPYRLVVQSGLRSVAELRGKALACRENIARSSPLSEAFQQHGHLQLGADLTLEMVPTDKDALAMLCRGAVQSALLTQEHAIAAQERGFERLDGWPGVADDPLPLLFETTEAQCREKRRELGTFLAAYREGIGYLKTHRDETMRMLQTSFGQSAQMAARAYDDFHMCLNDSLKVDMKQLQKLVADVAPQAAGGAQNIASKWIVNELLPIDDRRIE
jgi:ABC-type nitrate/sulfonate/bicarbonate transport system substrate-binding protein